MVGSIWIGIYNYRSYDIRPSRAPFPLPFPHSPLTLALCPCKCPLRSAAPARWFVHSPMQYALCPSLAAQCAATVHTGRSALCTRAWVAALALHDPPPEAEGRGAPAELQASWPLSAQHCDQSGVYSEFVRGDERLRFVRRQADMS